MENLQILEAAVLEKLVLVFYDIFLSSSSKCLFTETRCYKNCTLSFMLALKHFFCTYCYGC